ncbi:MAG: hypothetical protein ACI4JQ_05685 [Ruminococcus sp.]
MKKFWSIPIIHTSNGKSDAPLIHESYSQVGKNPLPFDRFGEALRDVQDDLNAKNFYCCNPSFDKNCGKQNTMKSKMNAPMNKRMKY